MIEPQTTINHRYRIDREIGAGGIGVVFRAHDLMLGRDVALKTLRPPYVQDAVLRRRFEREAAVVASFSHPHVVDVYDVGLVGAAPYFVMELISGESLASIIATEGPFHADDVAALLAQICSALDYVHERGYVHRDLKPANILVDDKGFARIVDFGFVKDLADVDLTPQERIVGTMQYIAPEQAQGLHPTPATDIYAAGVIAFEMLTGSRPFTGDSGVAIAMRHLQEAPPVPSRVRTGIPAAVDAIILTALAKEPTARFQRAGALATAMSSWREARVANLDRDRAGAGPSGSSGPPAPPPAPPIGPPPPAVPASRPAPDDGDEAPADLPPARSTPGCASWPVGVLIALVLAGLLFAGFQLSQRGPAAPTATPPPVSAVPAAPGVIATPPGPVSGSPAGTGLPDLTGQTLAAATDLLAQQGLAIATTEPVFSEAIPVDAVAEQDPPAGATVAAGETIYVKLSRGTATRDLIALELVGKSSGVAASTLRADDFAVAIRSVPDASVPADVVIRTEPDAQAVVGSTVTLVVSLGDVAVIPASLQGEPAAAAEAALREQGLDVAGAVGAGRATAEAAGLSPGGAGLEAGDVIAVRAEGGADLDFETPVARGTRVELIVYDPALDATP